jgi:F-type H+-transporting ATPase subunit delta
MEEIAQVYSRALYEVASEKGVTDEVRDQLRQFADTLGNDRQLMIFFFSPYFSTEEKKNGLHRGITDANEVFINFLETLLERHRMPAIFRIRDRYEQLWDRDHKLLPVHVTSAVKLDESTVKNIGESIGKQTGNEIELSSDVDPDILGGIVLRVGNFILDASIRSRLEQLRKQVAQA